MPISWTRRFLAAALILSLAACATSRSELRVASPPPAPVGVKAAPDAPAFRIREVIDARRFEQAPGDPSIPSLGFGGAAESPDAIKARAIGRKRNTYGKALGDVLLEEGQTVTGLVAQNLAAALERAGYRVEQSPDAPARNIDVRITQFWSWFQPGFWSIKLHSRVATELTVDSAQPVSIEAAATESRQAATEKAWLEIVDQALAQYRSEVVARKGALVR